MVMNLVQGLQIVPPTVKRWLPPVRRTAYLEPNGIDLVSIAETPVRSFTEADWVYLQIVLYAEQIHPWTMEDIDQLKTERDLARMSIEGPTFIRPGEPADCTMKVEVAHSLTATPGSDWREYRGVGPYKLRSFQARLTITLPTTDHSFRLYRFATRATRRGAPMRDTHVERLFSNA